MSWKEEIEKLKNELSLNIPKWNGKECGEGCNCVDIAEAKNHGEPVKECPCQSPHTPFDKD